MASVKADNERELTSTMGNVLSMSSKDEKNDTSDATPTSSTDANTTSTASQIVSDDPISSTSSDIVEQNKSKSAEAAMQSYVEANQAVVDEPDKSSSADPEADLLEMSISNVPNEKITEDVEDLVHDLESLLGESTDSFNVTIKRKKDRKSLEEKETSEQQQTSSTEVKEQDVLVSEDPVSSKAEEKDQDRDTKEDTINKTENDVSQEENQETKDWADKAELDNGSNENNVDENKKENGKQAEQQGSSLDRNTEQVDLVTDVSTKPQSSSESKNIGEAIVEEKSDISPRDDETSVEEITENAAVDSKPSMKASEVATEAKEQSDVSTRESRNDVEETKASNDVSELSDIKENRIEEKCHAEKAELNTDTTEIITVPKDMGNVGESVKNNEPEKIIEKKKELPEVVESNTEDLETVVHLREEMANIIAKDRADNKSKDTEVVECLEDIKTYEVLEVIQGGPSGDHKSELNTAQKETSASEKEDIVGDRKTESMENTESCSEESADKQQLQSEQVINEYSSKDESITNITEIKETDNLDEADPYAEENGSVDDLKEENVSSKNCSGTISSETVENSETEKLVKDNDVETSPDTSNALQYELAECEQVDGTNTESDENKPQSESTSNTDTYENKAAVNKPETVSESSVERPVESVAEDCDTNVKETEASEEENLEETKEVNEPESHVNIPEFTVDIVLETSEAKANVNPNGSPIEATATTSVSEASPISDKPTDDEVPSSQPVKQVATSNPEEESAVSVIQSALTTSKSEASPMPDKQIDDEVPSSQPVEQMAMSVPEEELAVTATQSTLIISKSETLPMRDEPVDDDTSNSQPVDQMATSDLEEEPAVTATQSAVTTSKSGASPMPDKPIDEEASSSQLVEQMTTSDPEEESAVTATQSALSTSKSEASPIPDKPIDDEAPSSQLVEQMTTSDPEEESAVTAVQSPLSTSKSGASPMPDKPIDDEVPSSQLVEQITTSDPEEESGVATTQSALSTSKSQASPMSDKPNDDEVPSSQPVELIVISDPEEESAVKLETPKSVETTTTSEISDDVVVINDDEIVGTISKLEEMEEKVPEDPPAELETHEVMEEISEKFNSKLTNDRNNEGVVTTAAEPLEMEVSETVADAETGIVDNTPEVTEIAMHSGHDDVTPEEAVQPDLISDKIDVAAEEIHSEVNATEKGASEEKVQTENVNERQEKPAESCKGAPGSDNTEDFETIQTTVDVVGPSLVESNGAEVQPENHTESEEAECKFTASRAENVDRTETDETRTSRNEADPTGEEPPILNDAPKQIDENPTPEDEIAMPVDETVYMNDAILSSVVETSNVDDGILQPNDQTADVKDDTPKSVVEPHNLDDVVPNLVEETQNPEDGILMAVDETADADDDTHKTIEGIANLRDAISHSVDETLNPEDGIPKLVDENIDCNDYTSKPIEDTVNLDDEIPNSVDETPNPDERIPNPLDETNDVNDDTSKPIEDAANLDKAIPNSADNIPDPDDGIPKPVDETADANDGTSKSIEVSPNPDDGTPNLLVRTPKLDDGVAKPGNEAADGNDDSFKSIEETPIMDDEILNSVDESPNPDEEVPMPVAETAVANDDTSKLIEEILIPSPGNHIPNPAAETPKPDDGIPGLIDARDDTFRPVEETLNLNDEIPNSLDQAPNPDDGVAKPVGKTADHNDDTSKPIESTPNPDDGIPNSPERAPNLDDGVANAFDETADANEDTSEPIEKTPNWCDGITNSVDETPDLENKVPMSVDETPSTSNESCKLVIAVVESGDQTSKLTYGESYSRGKLAKQTDESCEPTNEASKLEISELTQESLQLDENAAKTDTSTSRSGGADVEMENIPEAEYDDDTPSIQSSDIATLPDSTNERVEESSHLLRIIQDSPNNVAQTEKEDNRVIEISDDDSKAVDGGDIIQIISSSADSDSEELVPVLALEPDENNPSPKEPVGGKDDSETEKSSVEVHSVDVAAEAQPMPKIDDSLANQGQVDEAVASIDMQENLETILAVASLQNADSTEDDVVIEPQMSEKERREMEALRKAVESITENTAVEFDEDVGNVVGEQITDVDIPVESSVTETETVDETQDLPCKEPELDDSKVNVIIDKGKEEVDKVEDIDNGEDTSEKVLEQAESEGEITDQDVPELRIEDSAEEVEEHTAEENTIETKVVNAEFDENPQSLPDTSEDKVCKGKTEQFETTGVLPDSSQVILPSEDAKQSEAHKETKVRASERPKRHKKSGEIRLEELSINTDVPDKDKPYSPKITIKPIKVPDDEVSTTSNSDTEVGKGSLKMTITKQADKMHSILKICDPESSEAAQEQDEPIPKLIIKPKMQQVEQQHSPKMSTRSSKQVYSPTSTTQRSGSPRITIKPVVKPEKADTISPLKIKLKSEDISKKYSPKLNIKPVAKPEDETVRENVPPARKVIIKPVVKPMEEVEPVHSPRITIKPIPKPEVDKESTSNTPRLNIKPIKKQEEQEIELEKEKSPQKITIKPVVKPPEPDTQSPTDEEVKERIVLKINKGNLPTPTKDPKKREHPPDDDKSEKLAKITVKFSKGGGHPHIVQQPEESNKRAHDEQASPEKVKKQKTEVDLPIATRSKHKENVVELSVETRSKHKETTFDNPGSEHAKTKQKGSESPVREPSKTKHKDPISESPIEPKKLKLKETPSEMPVYESTRSRHKEPPCDTLVSETTRSKQKEHIVAEKPAASAENPGNVKVTVVETKVESPIVISEDSRSQDSGSCVIIEDLKDPLAAIPVFEIRAEPAKAMTPKQDTVTPVPATPPTPTPRKRGRPRKVPIVVREEFKEQEEPKPEPPKSEEPQPAQDSGRPKRSCRGQSVRATLGIKPRKPRGPGRGRGSKRGMGTRSVPMKPEREPKLSKAKLKLMQKSLQEEIAKAAEAEKEKKQLSEALVTDVDIKAPAPVLAPPETPFGEVPASPSTGLPVPSPQAPVASPASLPVASPKPAISLTATETSTADSVTPSTSTSTRVSGEIVMVDEETRMSADTNSRAQTPAKQVVPADAVVEESQSSVQSTATTESGKAASSRPNKAPRLEVQEPEGAVISADQLTEYYWNGNGPFMLQEQVAQFLGIKSFKRKYPGIMRRMLDMQERDFIRESGLASEHMCDLGLTAVNSADILDIMYSDFQEKYEEYCKHQRDRQAKDLINKQKALSLAASQEKNKADITEQAVQSAAQWNASFNKARREQRKACMDLQTLTVHYPKGKMKQINKTKVGNYPVALVPGQYTDYYKELTPTEINNLPINTMCYEPINIIPPEESDDSGSDGSDSDSDSSSSSSGSGSDSSSGVEDCKLCKHSPKKAATSK